MKRTVFFISDGTGITAEAIGQSLISQFENLEFEFFTLPYIDNIEKAQLAVEQINQAYQEKKVKPLIFGTLIDPKMRAVLKESQGLLMDLFDTFITPLEKELNCQSSYKIGRSHGLIDFHTYKTRIDAVNFALANDDGIGIHNYKDADLILIGISRCGKTPTSLYLALQFGVLTANYPFTADDLPHVELPTFLREFKQKLFGLTIEIERLHSIRNERRPQSQYASYEQCKKEIQALEQLYRRERIPYLNTTHFSIEEIATKILAQAGISRRIKG